MIAYNAPEERPITRKLLAEYHTTTLKTWIGGYRNRPEEWTEPKNWYPEGVPGWSDKVIIGGYRSHRCHIATGVDDVSALAILPGAHLEIGEGGRLTVDGLLADPLGMLGDSGLSNAGHLDVRGRLTLRNAALQGIQNQGSIHNEGKIYADESVSCSSSDWGDFDNYGSRIFMVSE